MDPVVKTGKGPLLRWDSITEAEIISDLSGKRPSISRHIPRRVRLASLAAESRQVQVDIALLGGEGDVSLTAPGP